MAELREGREQVERRWSDIAGAARYSGLSARTIKRLIAEDVLAGFRPRGKLLVDLNELDKSIEARAVGRGVAAAV